LKKLFLILSLSLSLSLVASERDNSTTNNSFFYTFLSCIWNNPVTRFTSESLRWVRFGQRLKNNELTKEDIKIIAHLTEKVVAEIIIENSKEIKEEIIQNIKEEIQTQIIEKLSVKNITEHLPVPPKPEKIMLKLMKLPPKPPMLPGLHKKNISIQDLELSYSEMNNTPFETFESPNNDIVIEISGQMYCIEILEKDLDQEVVSIMCDK